MKKRFRWRLVELMFKGSSRSANNFPAKHQLYKSSTKSPCHLRFSCVRGLIARAETASTKSPAVPRHNGAVTCRRSVSCKR